MTPLLFILLILAATLSLSVVACYVEARRNAGLALDPSIGSSATSAQPAVEAPQPAPWETFGYWCSKALRPLSVIAVIALVAEPILLASNTYILSQTLNLVFDMQPETLFSVALFATMYPVTVFTLGAVILTISQMICAAVVAAEVPGQPRCLLRWAAGLSLVLLAVVEICLNVDRTLVSGGSLLESVLSGVIAAALVVTESAVGALILDHLAVPLVLSFLWGSGSVFRALGRVIRNQTRRIFAVGPASGTRVLVGHGAVLEACDRFFSLFRALDEGVASIVRRVFRPKATGLSAGLLILLALAYTRPIAAQVFIRPEPRTPIDFYLVEDDSSSVSLAQFDANKFELSPQLVLRYMRPGDHLFVKTVGVKDNVAYFEFTGARANRLMEFFDHSIAPLRPAKPGSKDDTTDYGAAIRWCLRSVNDLQSSRRSQPVLVILTDGNPDAAQTPVSENLGSLRTFFVGVQRQNDGKLKAFLQRNRLTDKVDVIPFTAWQSYIAVYESKLGRQPNATFQANRLSEVKQQ